MRVEILKVVPIATNAGVVYAKPGNIVEVSDEVGMALLRGGDAKQRPAEPGEPPRIGIPSIPKALGAAPENK